MLLTVSEATLAFFGATEIKAFRICKAWEVGLEQTKWTQDWFLGWKIGRDKF